jgi:hypothetical protein
VVGQAPQISLGNHPEPQANDPESSLLSVCAYDFVMSDRTDAHATQISDEFVEFGIDTRGRGVGVKVRGLVKPTLFEEEPGAQSSAASGMEDGEHEAWGRGSERKDTGGRGADGRDIEYRQEQRLNWTCRRGKSRDLEQVGVEMGLGSEEVGGRGMSICGESIGKGRRRSLRGRVAGAAKGVGGTGVRIKRADLTHGYSSPATSAPSRSIGDWKALPFLKAAKLKLAELHIEEDRRDVRQNKAKGLSHCIQVGAPQ